MRDAFAWPGAKSRSIASDRGNRSITTAADIRSAFLPAGLDIDGAHRTADLTAAQRQRPRSGEARISALAKSRVQRLDQTTDVVS
jgi:hypothetical protein